MAQTDLFTTMPGQAPAALTIPILIQAAVCAGRHTPAKAVAAEAIAINRLISSQRLLLHRLEATAHLHRAVLQVEAVEVAAVAAEADQAVAEDKRRKT